MGARETRASVAGVVLMVLAGSTARAEPPRCADAEAIAMPALINATTNGALEDQGATACGVDDRHAVWYVLTAPAVIPPDERYTFEVTAGASPDSALTDTTLALYTACDAEPFACSDDQQYLLTSRLDLYLEPGQQVFVRVAGWGATRGDFTLRADTTAAIDRPINDLCEDALPVTQEHRAAGETLHASGTDLSACGPHDTVDLWYTFTAGAAGEYDFAITQNLLSQHYIAVFDRCDGSELACGFAGTHATLAAGQTVALRIGTTYATADWFNVVVGPPPPAVTPPNDAHTGAIPVGVPSVTQTSTWGATKDALNFGPDCGPWVNAAIWYAFTAPSDDVYVFDTSGSELEDTVVAVFDRCDLNGEAPPTLFECNDFDGLGHQGRSDGFLAAGQQVCIAVAGRYLSELGGITLTVSRLGEPPANDTCEDALPISAGAPVFGVNYASTAVEVLTQCPYGSFPLWYRFTAPADGVYKFDTKAGSDSWPDIALYAECGSRETLACSVEGQPAVDLTMTQGQSVLVRVSTDVWWRGIVPLRVGPVREADPGPEPEAVEVVEAVEADEAADEDPEDDGAEENAPEASDEGAIAGDKGCGCHSGTPAQAALAALAMLVLVLQRRS